MSRLIAVTSLSVLLALGSFATVARPNPPGPERRNGHTVKPTWSYTYTTWATTGEPMIVRVPLHGKRRATLRYGGAQ